MNQFKLSICILTYNEPNDVKRILTSLASQINDNVEIIIRDDSEGIETKIVVDDFKSLNNLTYINGVKEGIDKTVSYLINVANGEYVWWMGDDDIVENGVETVLNVLNKYIDIGFIWANYRSLNGDVCCKNITSNRFFKNLDEILISVGSGIGFVSSCIINKALAKESLKSSEIYIGTTFVNLFIVLFVITHSKRNYCISEVVVINHPASISEIKEITTRNPGIIDNRAFEVFGIHYSNIISQFKEFFEFKNTLSKIISNSFANTWRGVLVGWVGGWDTPKGKRILLLKTFWRIPEAWFAFTLFCLPKTLLTFLYYIYKKFNLKL